MDIKGLVNLFLSSATDLAQQGKQGAEKALNIPAEGEARSDTLSTLAKGALGGAVHWVCCWVQKAAANWDQPP